MDYFTLPGNERYYDFAAGPVHIFVIDSDMLEPDGNSSTSAQAEWLRSGLAASQERWDIVCFHHPPYDSGSAGDPEMRWPFPDWGAVAVLCGHHHVYERILKNGFPYFIDGLGGSSRHPFGNVEPDSQVRYNANFGAMRIDADDGSITFRFYAITGGGDLIDTFTINQSSVEPASWGAIKASYR